MTGRSTRWETDPLFSAAEVVQDSADRMESLYRLLMHELDLVHGDHRDRRMPSPLQFHKRNLVTAVETAKWQLEDFERAVHAISDETGLREHAIHGHKQFIDAIRDQVLSVQRALEEISVGDSGTSTQWTSPNEPDTLGLALFLSGENSRDHHLPDNSQNNIEKKFLDSNGTTDEIIEIEPDENVHLELKDTRHLNHASSSLQGDGVWKFGLNNSESSFFPEQGNLENGYRTAEDAANCNPEAGKLTTRYLLFSNNGAVRCLWEFVNKFWRWDRYRHSRTFTKKRKDGDITDDTSADMDLRRKKAFYSLDMSSAGQSKQSGFRIFPRPNIRELRPAVHVGKLLEPLSRRFERLQGGFSQQRLPVMALIAVTLIGVLRFGWLMW